jgi:hypothetical protein
MINLKNPKNPLNFGIFKLTNRFRITEDTDFWSKREKIDLEKY